jgi:hypothetical protein
MCQRGGCEWTEIREPGLNSHDDDGDGGMPQEYRSARTKNQDPPTFGIPRPHSTTHGERYFSHVGHAIQVPLTRLGIAGVWPRNLLATMLREHVLMPLHAHVRTSAGSEEDHDAVHRCAVASSSRSRCPVCDSCMDERKPAWTRFGGAKKPCGCPDARCQEATLPDEAAGKGNFHDASRAISRW